MKKINIIKAKIEQHIFEGGDRKLQLSQEGVEVILTDFIGWQNSAAFTKYDLKNMSKKDIVRLYLND